MSLTSPDSPVKPVTTASLRAMKTRGEKIAMLTAYDFTLAAILDEAGVDMVLVGDSLGMVMQGYDTTLPVTMEETVVYARSVARACKRALVAADMPFMSYQASDDEAMRNAGRLFKEASVQAVKLEGGEELCPLVERMTRAGMPVIGHLGLKPQSVCQLGGYKVQGRGEAEAAKILAEAKALEEAGMFMLVLECVPAVLAEHVTRELQVPTIGIGAGPACDGQVLVLHDMLGLYDRLAPKFVKRFADLKGAVRGAVESYRDEVKSGAFPTAGQSFE